jgi:hypothetical protein
VLLAIGDRQAVVFGQFTQRAWSRVGQSGTRTGPDGVCSSAWNCPISRIWSMQRLSVLASRTAGCKSLDIIAAEFDTTMALCGCNDIATVGREWLAAYGRDTTESARCVRSR